MSAPTSRSPDGLAAMMMEALDRFRAYRAGGMEFDEACRQLEEGLRAALPERHDSREWIDPCARCDGSGWEPYERWVPLYQGNARYVRYCECSKGQAMKASATDAQADGNGPKRRSVFRRLGSR